MKMILCGITPQEIAVLEKMDSVPLKVGNVVIGKCKVKTYPLTGRKYVQAKFNEEIY